MLCGGEHPRPLDFLESTAHGRIPFTSQMKKVLFALILAAILIFTINGQSLWTDEAFSAFVASHGSFVSCWATLVHGDSSDLQMALYYLFLHGWVSLFGQSEIAFRSANIPFILLYSGVLVWASERLFHARLVWMAVGLTPLAFVFAGDTRPYFDVIALSVTCVGCLLAYLREPSDKERRILPWLALLCVLVGAMFHMLMLLLGPPLVVMLAVFYGADRTLLRWRDWKWPLIVLTPVSLALAAYFAWTFGRGASYDYAKPDALSMASVLFRFAGLSGFAPNRRYEIGFRPFLLAMSLSTLALGAGLAALFAVKRRAADRVCFLALASALGMGLIEFCALCLAAHQQVEFRHLSSLLPLLMLMVMAGLSLGSEQASNGKYVMFAALAITGTWLISDARLLAPDYQREDFRAAVQQTLALHRQAGAPIAVAADPVAAAYYGLEMRGPKPCFPLIDSCEAGFANLPWPKKAPAEYALFWTAAQVEAWLAGNKTGSVLLISRSRHPMIAGSAWWPVLAKRAGVRVYPEFGFYVYLVP